MNASAAAMFGNGGGSSAREGFALREHSFIQQTESQLDGFIAQGREVWNSLTEQRDILKGTQKRLRDVGVTMGLSRDVIVSGWRAFTLPRVQAAERGRLSRATSRGGAHRTTLSLSPAPSSRLSASVSKAEPVGRGARERGTDDLVRSDYIYKWFG